MLFLRPLQILLLETVPIVGGIICQNVNGALSHMNNTDVMMLDVKLRYKLNSGNMQTFTFWALNFLLGTKLNLNLTNHSILGWWLGLRLGLAIIVTHSKTGGLWGEMPNSARAVGLLEEQRVALKVELKEYITFLQQTAFGVCEANIQRK